MNDLSQTNTDFDAIKSKQQTAWGSGDYGRIGVTLQITGEQLCESMDLRSGQSVLDVAAGNGNATMAAARRFCNVTSTDYVQSLLDESYKRCQTESLAADFQLADAENLAFDDNSFDNVISTFGVMFTPNQNQSASELIRVCKPGGNIGMANWTPDGFIGQLFKTIGKYVAPAAGISSPAKWGTQAFLEENFSTACSCIETQIQVFNFRYQSPAHWLDLFSNYYGPLLKTFEALDSVNKQQLKDDILKLIDNFNQADDGTAVIASEYLQVVITK